VLFEAGVVHLPANSLFRRVERRRLPGARGLRQFKRDKSKMPGTQGPNVKVPKLAPTKMSAQTANAEGK